MLFATINVDQSRERRLCILTIEELIERLQQVPADQRFNPVLIFDKETGVCHPLTDPKKTLPADRLSEINPLLLEINGDKNWKQTLFSSLYYPCVTAAGITC